MVKAVVVGSHRGTIELLQRRIGGILKDIAQVGVCWFDKVDVTEADIYFCYSEGVRLSILQEKFKNTSKIVLGVELTLLPAGVRSLNALPKGSRLMVLAEHLGCANRFMSEIIQAGVADYQFRALQLGSIDSISKDVDYYVVPEDLADYASMPDPKKPVILIPRTVTPACASAIIRQAMKKA